MYLHHQVMGDWEQFLHDVSWFLRRGQRAIVGEAQPWNRGWIQGLPELSALLGSATLTPVSVERGAYELLAWGRPEERRGWLCHPPHGVGDVPVTRVQQSFWRLCGGIVERFGEPDTWWNNQNQVLTADAARVGVADIFTDFAWLWKEDGLEMPIQPRDYYAVAVEANGNLTLAHRDNGRLLLFAPDHAFTGVTPLAGCPPYSLLTIDDVPDVSTWIEVCAAAWLNP